MHGACFVMLATLVACMGCGLNSCIRFLRYASKYNVAEPQVGLCLLLCTGNKSVPIQLAQCWFPGLAISDAKI